MLNRTGHFWEQRYHSTTFATTDTSRALNSLRYIHANPKAARISSGFAYRYSNYATYEKLTDDQLTEWHPAFLRLGQSLDECAARYRAFCRGHRIEAKPGGRRSFWARRWLPDVRATQAKSRSVPGQMGLWERC
jgi:putative transposase